MRRHDIVFGFGVGIEAKRASNFFFEILKDRIYGDPRLNRNKLILYSSDNLCQSTKMKRDTISVFRENSTKSITTDFFRPIAF